MKLSLPSNMSYLEKLFERSSHSPGGSKTFLRNAFRNSTTLKHQKLTSESSLNCFKGDDEDFLNAKQSLSDNEIDWDFGRSETEEFLSRPKKNREMCLPLVHHHGFVCEIPPKHRFVMGKFDGLYNYLMMDRFFEPSQLVHPPAVSASICSLVHNADYIRRFFLGETSEKEQRRTGFKWTPGLVRRCRLETGATILAARLAMETGIACSSGGGTHHAFPTFGSGYCLINDLGIAAKFVVESGIAAKVLILDLDVHQGDGTAAMFQDDPRVFTLSVHNAKNFPLTKQRSDLDVALEDKVGDSEYLKTIVDLLPSVVDLFQPDLVLYDAGIDPHIDDALGRLSLTDEGLYDRDYYVLQHLFKRGIPVATVIGGGYSDWWDDVALRHSIVHRAATHVFRDG